MSTLLMLYCAVVEKIVSARLWADCASTEIVGQGSWVGGCLWWYTINTAVCWLQDAANAGAGGDSDMEDLESSVLESSGVQQQQQSVVSMFILRLAFVELSLTEASSFRIQLLLNGDSYACSKIRSTSKAWLLTAQR